MKEVGFEDKSYKPSKVVCIGRNYVEHIKELGNEMPSNVVLFNKPNSAIADRLYYFDEGYRYEAEICFLVLNGEIAGVGVGLDLTDAKTQEYLKSKSLPWERAKAFDNSAVFSSFVTARGVDIDSLEMMLYIDGELRQNAKTTHMIYKIETILKEIKSFMTLENGDIIMSGTPKGVGSYAIGQKFKLVLKDGNNTLLEKEFTVEEKYS